MKNMKAKLAALEAMTERGMGDSVEGKMPPHDVKCPNCGHEWTMGEEEDSEDSKSSY